MSKPSTKRHQTKQHIRKSIKSAVQYTIKGTNNLNCKAHTCTEIRYFFDFFFFPVQYFTRKVSLCARDVDYIPEDNFRVLNVLDTDSCYIPHYVTPLPEKYLQLGSATGAVVFI